MQKVVTHSGNYHPDDVFAVATLQLSFGKENIEIIRSRVPEVINSGDFVVDVGEIYDVANKRFDHHQKGAPVRLNGIPYAAFGLVWKELGESLTGSKNVADYIDEKLVQPIDAGDNGHSLYTLHDHSIRPFELFSVINSFKPPWGSDKDYDEAFLPAVDFARDLLERMIKSGVANFEMAKYADSVYEAATDKTILVFDKSVYRHYCVKFTDTKAIIYSSDSGGMLRWKAEVIPTGYESFEDRCSFPEAWGGLRERDLTAVSGIEDAMFCHKGRHLFVAKTKEAAIQAARQVVCLV
jgi:uncharacterized UPF0160 family protein